METGQCVQANYLHVKDCFESFFSEYGKSYLGEISRSRITLPPENEMFSGFHEGWPCLVLEIFSSNNPKENRGAFIYWPHYYDRPHCIILDAKEYANMYFPKIAECWFQLKDKKYYFRATDGKNFYLWKM